MATRNFYDPNLPHPCYSKRYEGILAKDDFLKQMDFNARK